MRLDLASLKRTERTKSQRRKEEAKVEGRGRERGALGGERGARM